MIRSVPISSYRDRVLSLPDTDLLVAALRAFPGTPADRDRCLEIISDINNSFEIVIRDIES